MICPLCKNPNSITLETIDVFRLQQLYVRFLGPEIKKEFEGVDELTFNHCQRCDLMYFYPFIVGSSKLYEKLQQFSWYYQDEKDEYDYALQFITLNDYVLEIGCGKGAFARKITKDKYTGLEYNQKAINQLKSSGLNVFAQSIQEHAPYNLMKYDIVCAFQVLEHIDRISDFIESAIACLKPGGKLILSVPSADSFVRYSQNQITNMPPHHLSWWTDKALQAIAQIYGIEEIVVYHERVSEEHRQWYLRVLFQIALNNLLRRKWSLIDRSFIHRIGARFIKYLARFADLGFDYVDMRPWGHTVTAIYRKPSILS